MAIVVDEPIINEPFSEPTRHYRAHGGEPELRDERRPSGYTPGLRTRGGQTSVLEEDYVELPAVNEIRRHVAGWRQAGYPGATRTTLDLFRHWTREGRDRRLFFCQIEAAETAIWLIEGPQSERAIASVLEQQEAYVRHCIKMATGSGKTIVMGMLIAWSLLNKARQPSDRRFSDAVLVVCPNLTVKERLRVLRPSEGDNLYEDFDLVPPGTAAGLHAGRVMITNWHAFAVADDARRRGVVKRGRESAGAFASRVLRSELGSKSNLLVINDEAHHAWRQAPASPTDGPPPAGSIETTVSVDEDLEEARIWLEGLALIHRARGINRALDLSATPYYLSGSGHAEGEPFGWIVSDFSLLDAIESGIVKVPRLPVDDNSGDPDPRYLDLWERVKGKLPKRARGTEALARKDERLIEEVAGAIATLASAWKDEYVRWADEDRPVPPAMIVVCDQTATAERVADHIGKAGAVLPELVNEPDAPMRTLRIDSRLLEKAEEQLEPGQTKEKMAEELRRMVATVGKPGEAGASVRCVVSVAMLSEGWDARNVTQILGLRAFSSQLLCEQVVGRGLRRYSYDDMSVPEYVDVYGIPFQAFPVKGQRRGSTALAKPQTLVQALRDRRGLELRFPRVVGYISDAKFRITADVAAMPRLSIDPARDPYWVKVGQRGLGKGAMHERRAFYEAHRLQRTVFEIAAKITDDLKFGDEDGRRIMFPQVAALVRRYMDERVDVIGDGRLEELALPHYRSLVESRLADGIRPADEEGEQPLLPVLNDLAPIGSTQITPFMTIKSTVNAERSHLSHAVVDSGWERTVARALDESPRVRAWVKNERLGFDIPYRHGQDLHHHTPDFLVEVVGEKPTFLVVEVKGLEREQDRSKEAGAHRWIDAVNHWGKLGHWRYAKIYSPHQLESVLAVKPESLMRADRTSPIGGPERRGG
jgi:type III restriction enzyme